MLTTNHRTDSDLLLNVVNDFYAEDDLFRTIMLLQFINNRITFDTLEDVPYIYPLHSQCDCNNMNRLLNLFQNMFHFQFDSNNSYFNSNVSLLLRKSFRYYSSLKTCVGARVMLLVNMDVDGGLVNGSLGVVTEIVVSPNPEIKVDFITGNTTI